MTFLLLVIFSSCNIKIKYENEEKVEKNSIAVGVKVNDTVATIKELDENFRIYLKTPNEVVIIKPAVGLINLANVDSLQEISIMYKKFGTQIKGEMLKHEKKFFFDKKANTFNVLIDTYPFNSTTLKSFNSTRLKKDKYLFNIKNDIWELRCLEDVN
jgi:hypothetical protein